MTNLPFDRFDNILSRLVEGNQKTTIKNALIGSDIENENDLRDYLFAATKEDIMQYFNGLTIRHATIIKGLVSPQNSFSMSNIGVALPPPPPKEIKPESINGEILYEREDACKQIVEVFFERRGLRVTPICDNCFGAGKTSLMYKFRKILNSLPPDKWSWPERSELLKNAIYVHVPMNYSFTMNNNMDFNSPISIDMMLINKFKQVFSESLDHKILDCSSVANFVESLSRLAGEAKFFIHIDEVGVFDQFEAAKHVYYRILHFGEAFRSRQNYYVVTGRSRYLHTVGQNIKQYPTDFSSPCLTELIQLSPVTINAVVSMFKEHQSKLPHHLFDSNGEPNNEIVKFIHDYSGGVPRAVYAGLFCFKRNPHASENDVKKAIRSDYNVLTLHLEDKDLFKKCLEYSWSQIQFEENSTICNESITDIIARLGIYRNYIVGDKFTLDIPQFIRDIHLSEYNLMNIAKTTEKGLRLEAGFRRIFHLRTQLSPKNWIEFELPILSSYIRFPHQFFHESLPFPKIATNGTNDETAAAQCMYDINSRNVSISNSVFHFSCLSALCSEMEIGRYYQPFEKSSSADAMVRCGERDLLCFQFKNFQSQFKVSKLSEEMKKCIIPGWNVTLVLVCSSGYENVEKYHQFDSSNIDYCVDINGVHGIILSYNSVLNFMGENTISELSSTSLYDDAIRRQEHVELLENVSNYEEKISADINPESSDNEKK